MELIMTCLLLVGFFILSRQAATCSIQTDKMEKNTIIVIDPGHGGVDPGVVGINGIEEKNINLQIALKLKKILQEKGFDIYMIREEDNGLYDASSSEKKTQDMRKRVEYIEQINPLLTISIHQNSFPDSSVKGPQIFYHSNSSESRKLAEILQERLNQNLKVERPRNAKENQSYFLLKKTSGTIVIAECGFLTNPVEAVLLTNGDYQEKIVEAIMLGIQDYLEVEQKK